MDAKPDSGEPVNRVAGVDASRTQFGRVAQAYATSNTHRSGPDLDRLKSLVPAGVDVLDLGTGAGHVLKTLAPQARSAVGIDPTPEMLAAARGVLGDLHVTLVCAAAEDLPFPDGSFDVVVSRLAAHHFTAPDEAFAEVRRVLRPHGTLYLVDNYSPDDDLLDAWLNDLERLKDPSHVRSYRLGEWIELLEGVGLDARVDSKFRTKIVTDDWLQRSEASAEAAERAHEMLRSASPDARERFEIRPDGFSLFKALFVGSVPEGR